MSQHTRGIWTLAGGRLDCIDGFAPGPPIVLVPAEAVLTLAVPLPPLGSTMRRREALPFAVEDAIAEPLDQVHVALGAEQAPGVWLAAIVSHHMMRDWATQIDDAGLARAIVLPDCLRLPVPPESQWSIARTDSRVLVRTDDGRGFALPPAQFEAAWRAAGEPPLDEPPACHITPLDLRQGAWAAPRQPLHPLWRRAAWIAGIGALAHGVIAIADTAALTHQVHLRDAQVRALAAGLQPPVVIGADPADTLDALAPDGSTAPDAFMVLLSRSAAAISAGSSATLWRSVAFDRAAGTLKIEIETGDIADLQRIAQALAKSGLSAQPGAATNEGGRALGSFVIHAS